MRHKECVIMRVYTDRWEYRCIICGKKDGDDEDES